MSKSKQLPAGPPPESPAEMPPAPPPPSLERLRTVSHRPKASPVPAPVPLEEVKDA